MLKKYINNQITIEELIQNFNKNNYSKNNGVIYTPKYLADYIIEQLKPQLIDTIFEPSLGHGIFIFSLLEYIQKTFKLSGKELKNYFIKNVYGMDLNLINIKEFKLIVLEFFKKQNIVIDLKELNNFFNGDTLKYKPKNKFDIIIGNPPYINIRIMDKNYITFLRNNYISCEKGNIDIYYAFIEYALKYSYKSSYIVPNSWLYNISAKRLRKLIKPNLIKIIDFKQLKIFNNASTYTSIFVLDNNQTNYIKYSEKIDINSEKIKKNLLNDNRWSFFEKNISLKLKSINYHTPIATLRDKIYINPDIKENKDLISFYKISKIKNNKDFFKNEQKIIFPYKLVNNKYILKNENELEKDTLNYLTNNKSELAKRDKGKQEKYSNWYAYGRKQGFNIYKLNTYLIPIPGIISQSFKFFAIPTNIIKQPFLFSSGFILELNKKEKDILLNFLNNKDFKTYLKNNGKVWKGKTINDTYYSLSITQFKNILN